MDEVLNSTQTAQRLNAFLVPRMILEEFHIEQDVDISQFDSYFDEMLQWRVLAILPDFYPTSLMPPPSPPPQRAYEIFKTKLWLLLIQTMSSKNKRSLRSCEDQSFAQKSSYRIFDLLSLTLSIICLQNEVDHFRFFERVLETQGYTGVFMPKPDSPCIYVPGNNGPDGCAIFYDHKRFKLVDKHTRIIEVWHVQSNQVAILIVLEEISSSRQIMVVTTHLKARQGALLSSLRNEQGKDLLSFIDMHRGDEPLIVCGDFNADPSEPVYNTMTVESTSLVSAYAELNGGSEPAYSTWKIRGDGESCHNIDYFFYTPNTLRVNGGLNAPTEEALGVNRAPSFSYPSDHFSLVADFAFTKTTQNEDSS
ncbi:unnamed protein product, partial [Meganyctiphanes norvegica]